MLQKTQLCLAEYNPSTSLGILICILFVYNHNLGYFERLIVNFGVPF